MLGCLKKQGKKVVKDSTRRRETLTVTEKKALSNIRTNTYHAILLAKAAPK
jgi:hypothetical protein